MRQQPRFQGPVRLGIPHVLRPAALEELKSFGSRLIDCGLLGYDPGRIDQVEPGVHRNSQLGPEVPDYELTPIEPDSDSTRRSAVCKRRRRTWIGPPLAAAQASDPRPG